MSYTENFCSPLFSYGYFKFSISTTWRPSWMYFQPLQLWFFVFSFSCSIFFMFYFFNCVAIITPHDFCLYPIGFLCPSIVVVHVKPCVKFCSRTSGILFHFGRCGLNLFCLFFQPINHSLNTQNTLFVLLLTFFLSEDSNHKGKKLSNRWLHSSTLTNVASFGHPLSDCVSCKVFYC